MEVRIHMVKCNCIVTRGGVYDEISPEPKGNPEGGAIQHTEDTKDVPSGQRGWHRPMALEYAAAREWHILAQLFAPP